jgi:uncharacterized protein (TIGR02145 family)
MSKEKQFDCVKFKNELQEKLLIESGVKSLRGYAEYANKIVGNYGFWWSVSEDSSDDTFIRYMYYRSEDVLRSINDKSSLQSVRCVQD